MRLSTIPEEFLSAEPVIKTIQANGFEAYFVGGSVRDVLLNKTIHDVDIATSAYPEEIKKIFPRTIDVGIEHGTVLVLDEDNQYEITTFRTESTYQDFRRPDNVTFVRSLKDDLKRRDFTINALAMDINGDIVDLFDGINDLENKVIRAVGNPKERFHEDALRMMRGLRFASQLDFTIEPETMSAIQVLHSLLDKISVERITVEFIKLLLGKNRKAALVPFIESECYQYCPGLRQQGESLLKFTDLPDKQIEAENQAWTLLIHCLNIAEEHISHFLKQWKLSNQMIHQVQQLYYGLNKRLENSWELLDVFKLGLESVISIEKMLFYFGENSKLEEAQRLFDSLPIQQRKQLAITGNDLLSCFTDRTPGKWLGELIDSLEVAVVKGSIPNDKQQLIHFAKETLEKEGKN